MMPILSESPNLKSTLLLDRSPSSFSALRLLITNQSVLTSLCELVKGIPYRERGSQHIFMAWYNQHGMNFQLHVTIIWAGTLCSKQLPYLHVLPPLVTHSFLQFSASKWTIYGDKVYFTQLYSFSKIVGKGIVDLPPFFTSHLCFQGFTPPPYS